MLNKPLFGIVVLTMLILYSSLYLCLPPAIQNVSKCKLNKQWEIMVSVSFSGQINSVRFWAPTIITSSNVLIWITSTGFREEKSVFKASFSKFLLPYLRLMNCALGTHTNGLYSVDDLGASVTWLLWSGSAKCHLSKVTKLLITFHCTSEWTWALFVGLKNFPPTQVPMEEMKLFGFMAFQPI